MESGYKPYFDPDFESLIQRMHPPRVCIDNDTCDDCTLVKVDSVNKHGILLEMVEVLTDLDLVITKSYISSDVFHVRDQLGNKLTEESLIRYIKQALGAGGKGWTPKEVQTCMGRVVRPKPVSTAHTALEMTVMDRPGLLSEISAVLAELGCQVNAVSAWTHNSHAASIIYIGNKLEGGGTITDPDKLAQVEEQLENVVGAHYGNGERMRVRFASPTMCKTHTERRLHQLMYADRDYERCNGGTGTEEKNERCNSKGTKVSIEIFKEKGYSVVSVKCTDRPKLLFDTVCTLTDMNYVVSHASISSKGAYAVQQEYYIRHMDGYTLDTENERRRVRQCLEAAIERRVPQGLRLDVCTKNRVGLLSDITRVFRENGLSVSSTEISTHGEKAVGFFYVTDASGNYVDQKTVELVRHEIGVTTLKVNRSPVWTPRTKSSSIEEKPKVTSFGSLLWSQLERLSGNFSSIRS
ncbi:ACT domain [Macleaya cordata]|uniref:ACT domain-containing protein ACR n=1 Tax=Macleaya cordata TaxID=56857 RepID=A0A200QJS3_MACCD|nr:ACT domain [Macleaya cordata]